MRIAFEWLISQWLVRTNFVWKKIEEKLKCYLVYNETVTSLHWRNLWKNAGNFLFDTWTKFTMFFFLCYAENNDIINKEVNVWILMKFLYDLDSYPELSHDFFYNITRFLSQNSVQFRQYYNKGHNHL